MVKTLTETLNYFDTKKRTPTEVYNELLLMNYEKLRKYGLILLGCKHDIGPERTSYFVHKNGTGISMIDRRKDFFLEYKSFSNKALKEAKSSLVKLLREVDFL